MKLILFATLQEAEETISFLKATKSSDKLYTYSEGTIVISGIGNFNAMMAVSHYGNNVDHVINLGIAGSFNDYPLFSCFNCTFVGKYSPLPESTDEHSKSYIPAPISLASQGGHSLISSEFPIYSTALRSELKKKWDLVDMEGYGVAFAGTYLKKKVTLLKLTSDFAQEGGRNLIFQNIKKLSGVLAEKLYESGLHQ